MGELSQADVATSSSRRASEGFATTKVDALLGWAQKYSLFMYPFVTACCGMEFMALSSPRFDLARFGAEAPRFSPRQARSALGRRHDQPAPGARAEAHLRADDGAEVGARVRHLRVAAAASTTTTRRVAGIDKIIPCRRVHARLPAAARGRARRSHAPPGQDPDAAIARPRPSSRAPIRRRVRRTASCSSGERDSVALSSRKMRMARALIELVDSSTFPARRPRDALAAAATTPSSSTPRAWKAVARFLRDDPRARLSTCSIDLCGVDYPDREPALRGRAAPLLALAGAPHPPEGARRRRRGHGRASSTSRRRSLGAARTGSSARSAT